MVARKWKKGKTEPALFLDLQIATVGNSMEMPQKVKNRTAMRSCNSTSGYLSRENQNTKLKRYLHLYAHCSSIYSNQDMEATLVSFDR